MISTVKIQSKCCSGTKHTSSSLSDQNVVCSRHGIAEKSSHLALNNNHSLTKGKF